MGKFDLRNGVAIWAGRRACLRVKIYCDSLAVWEQIDKAMGHYCIPL